MQDCKLNTRLMFCILHEQTCKNVDQFYFRKDELYKLYEFKSVPSDQVVNRRRQATINQLL